MDNDRWLTDSFLEWEMLSRGGDGTDDADADDDGGGGVAAVGVAAAFIL